MKKHVLVDLERRSVAQVDVMRDQRLKEMEAAATYLRMLGKLLLRSQGFAGRVGFGVFGSSSPGSKFKGHPASRT